LANGKDQKITGEKPLILGENPCRCVEKEGITEKVERQTKVVERKAWEILLQPEHLGAIKRTCDRGCGEK
jgi:hypothetical protein